MSLISFASNGLKDILMYNKPRIMKTNKKLFLLILSSLERKVNIIKKQINRENSFVIKKAPQLSEAFSIIFELNNYLL